MILSFTWQHASTESQELAAHPEELQALQEALARRRTHCLLIVRHDRIVWECYAAEWGPDRPHYTASLAKALVGGMSLMAALDDGRVEVDDPAWNLIPAWTDDPLKAKITIRHLATHCSGLEDAEEDGRPHDALTGWKGDFWKRRPDPFSLALREAPVLFEPGSRYAYSNPGRRRADSGWIIRRQPGAFSCGSADALRVTMTAARVRGGSRDGTPVPQPRRDRKAGTGNL